MTHRGFITPFQARFGRVPDISDLLAFRFWEPVYYLDPEESFPHSKEKKGYWVGTAENVGDALTYWIIPEEEGRLRKPIARSVVRSASDPKLENRRLDPVDEELEEEIATKLSEIFGSNRSIDDTRVNTRVRRDKPIHNRKHLRNKKKSSSNSPIEGRPSATDGNRMQNQDLIDVIDLQNEQDHSTDERATDRHSSKGLMAKDGPDYGASRSPADAGLPTIPRIFREIGGPTSGSNRGGCWTRRWSTHGRQDRRQSLHSKD